MEKTISEICLICNGERWVDDPEKAGQSIPCKYCGSTGWVTVVESNFSPEKTEPPLPDTRKPEQD